MKNRKEKWMFQYWSPPRGNGLQEDQIVNVPICTPETGRSERASQAGGEDNGSTILRAVREFAGKGLADQWMSTNYGNR
jgi:hypothetical protein